MFMQIDIKTLGKLIVCLLAAVFLLSACSDGDARKNNAFDTGGTSSVSATDKAEKAASQPTQGLDCWQGNVLKIIYDVIGDTIMKQYKNLSAGALNVMMMGFAVWLAIRILKFVSSVAEANVAEVWNEILKKAFICLFCGVMAGSTNMLLSLLNYTLFPIYGTFLEFGNEIMSVAENKISSVTVFDEKINFAVKTTCAMVGEAKASIEGGFPSSYETSMNCMICNIVDKLRIGRKMAYVSMSMPGLLPVVTGMLVMAMFQMVIWGFVFYLVDSIFRFGMMVLMLPIFVMAYAFGPTKKWTNIAFGNIMHSAAFMMAFATIISAILLGMMTLLTDPETGKLFNPDDASSHFSQISLVTICLVLIGFLVWKSLETTQQLTTSIIGIGVESKFQQNLKAVAGALKDMFFSGIDWALKKSGFYDNTKLGRALTAGGDLKRKMSEIAGRPQK